MHLAWRRLKKNYRMLQQYLRTNREKATPLIPCRLCPFAFANSVNLKSCFTLKVISSFLKTNSKTSWRDCFLLLVILKQLNLVYLAIIIVLLSRSQVVLNVYIDHSSNLNTDFRTSHRELKVVKLRYYQATLNFCFIYKSVYFLSFLNIFL